MNRFLISKVLIGALVVSAFGTVLRGAVDSSNERAALTTGQDADDADDYRLFYHQLAPYGDWVQSGRYGWVWHPRGVSVDWRPYTVGHWVYTDGYGWVWDSTEPWGWATSHYGRWTWDDTDGWVWVPGNVWGPAWVAWRDGGGYIGWAPLPPEVTWNPDSGLDWGSFRFGNDYWRPEWNFVRNNDFDDPSIQDRIAPEARSGTLFDRTQDATDYRLVHSRVVNRSIDRDGVRRYTGHGVIPYRLRDHDTYESYAAARPEANVLDAYRPNIITGDAGHEPGEYAVQRERLSEDELRQRQAEETRAFEQRQNAQEQRLAEIHRDELAHPPSAFTRDQLERAHAQEMNAFRAHRTYMRGFMHRSQERERASWSRRRP